MFLYRSITSRNVYAVSRISKLNISSLSAKLTFPIINESYEQPTGLFINNEFVEATSGKTFKVISPIDESYLCDVQEADANDVDIAVEAAAEAFKTWKDTPAYERGRYLYKLADLIERDADILAKIESLDNGKSLAISRVDVGMVLHFLRYCAGYADKIDGRTIATDTEHLTYTRREPLGVCGQITPWNFPLVMWSWKVGPSLATGNTVVIKPASVTSLSNLYASKLVKEAGIPPGVVNLIPGSGSVCGNAIINHPKIKKVSFTGSTAVGRRIMAGAANSNLKKVTLEFGGKSPNIVFDDADIDVAVDSLVQGILLNGGQVCFAGSRIYIQEGIYDKILPKLKEAFLQIKIGNPFEEGVFQGAQTTPDQFKTVMNYIQKGNEGAKVLFGAKSVGDKGFFVSPTLFYDCTKDMTIVKEEIFGPVAALQKFKTIDEVVEWANDSNYGLAAGVHTKDLNKAIAVADRLEAGSVWINTYGDVHPSVPFGGYKESGMGKEMGLELFDSYTQVKVVRAKLYIPKA